MSTHNILDENKCGYPLLSGVMFSIFLIYGEPAKKPKTAWLVKSYVYIKQ